MSAIPASERGPAYAVDRLAAAITEVAGHPAGLDRPHDPAHGDYATNVALRTARVLGRPPRELAEELLAKVAALPEVERAEVAGPGFVNLWLRNAFFVEAAAEMGEDYGAGWAPAKERVQVELVSANPTGPVTVASARNGAYGDSIARLLEFAGHEVEREYYVNDAGGQIERFRASVEAVRDGGEPPEGGYTGAYVAGLAHEEGDPVERMLGQIRESLGRFRIEFDRWQHESELVGSIPAALGRIDTYEAEGTVWARTSAHGDEKDRPLLRSEDGSHLYFAADVAYVLDKFERGFDRLIYVLGADHHGYVARLKAAAAMLGQDPDRVEVLLYQLVQLVRAGEKTKMQKRSGEVVFLDELIDEIGVDAARWFLVNRGPDQPIEIDVELAATKLPKNPVYYVQYAHARIAGILRNASTAQVGGEPAAPLEPQERELVKRLAEFPTVVREAGERRAPQQLTAYAIVVADDFHRFYDTVRVLESESEAFRLGLCRATQRIVARCLDLVGVEAPQRM